MASSSFCDLATRAPMPADSVFLAAKTLLAETSEFSAS
jgi:hypothetical protein